MNILITGGAGYIGSHTVLECLMAGHTVTVIDSLINASVEALHRVETLSAKKIHFYEGDVSDKNLLTQIFKNHPIEAVIHFAALKAVGESSKIPLTYYQNNITGTLVLLAAMQTAGINQLIFSSSATVYGDPIAMPVREESALQNPLSPYGATKAMLERILTDVVRACPQFKVVLLRYFNPVGNHESGYIGENPRGTPNNLTPYLTQVAIGKRPELAVFGKDYNTPDGTCIRDYVHVVDVARGHLAALEKLPLLPALSLYNLGTGRGHSVLELIDTFQRVTGITLPYHIAPRRAGDVAILYADVSKASTELHWQAKYDLAAMLAHAWKWQQLNPEGYTS